MCSNRIASPLTIKDNEKWNVYIKQNMCNGTLQNMCSRKLRNMAEHRKIWQNICSGAGRNMVECVFQNNGVDGGKWKSMARHVFQNMAEHGGTWRNNVKNAIWNMVGHGWTCVPEHDVTWRNMAEKFVIFWTWQEGIGFLRFIKILLDLIMKSSAKVFLRMCNQFAYKKLNTEEKEEEEEDKEKEVSLTWTYTASAPPSTPFPEMSWSLLFSINLVVLIAQYLLEINLFLGFYSNTQKLLWRFSHDVPVYGICGI